MSNGDSKAPSPHCGTPSVTILWRITSLNRLKHKGRRDLSSAQSMHAARTPPPDHPIAKPFLRICAAVLLDGLLPSSWLTTWWNMLIYEEAVGMTSCGLNYVPEYRCGKLYEALQASTLTPWHHGNPHPVPTGLRRGTYLHVRHGCLFVRGTHALKPTKARLFQYAIVVSED